MVLQREVDACGETRCHACGDSLARLSGWLSPCATSSRLPQAASDRLRRCRNSGTLGFGDSPAPRRASLALGGSTRRCACDGPAGAALADVRRTAPSHVKHLVIGLPAMWADLVWSHAPVRIRMIRIRMRCG